MGRDLKRQEDALTVGMAALRADMQAGFLALRQDIRDLPDINARVTQAERRIGEIAVGAQALETRVGRISDAVTETRAEVNAISRASDAPLGARSPARATR